MGHPSVAAVTADAASTCSAFQHVKVSPTTISTGFPFGMVVANLMPVIRKRNVGCLVVSDYNNSGEAWLSLIVKLQILLLQH